MRTSRSRQKKARIRNRLAMLAITSVTMLLLGVFLVQAKTLKEQIAEYEEREQQLNEQIDEEKRRTREIREMKDYMQTNEYAEEVARTRLGMVKENEIVFKEEE